MSFLSSLASLRQNSLITENLFVNPPKVGSYSNLESVVKKSVTTDTSNVDIEDTAEISKEAYKQTILDGIKTPESPIGHYGNNFNNMIVNYINKDINYDFLNR